MILLVCTVRDSASQAYGRPFFVAAKGQAIRSFSDEVNRPGDNNELNRHPDDFELYAVAQFDDNAGRFLPFAEPDLLIRGKDAVIPKE